MEKRIAQLYLAEFIGTFILVFFGVGAVHAVVLTGAQSGLWGVALVWGVAISMAIYALGALSGAHLNPALTLAFAAWRGFPRRRVIPYILAQLAGAFAAAATLYVLFHGFLEHFEAVHKLVRGGAGSELSAQVYGEYFPNPGIRAALKASDGVITLPVAMLAEALGTAFLAFFVFAVTDERHAERLRGSFAAPLIGLMAALIIAVVAPLTQAGLNPARDFGPRLFAYLMGWGRVAIPGPRGGFFMVYILAPIVGGMSGGAVYELLIKPVYMKPAGDVDISKQQKERVAWVNPN